MKSIIENIRIIRESKGYSQDYLADIIGISQSSYARFERGATKTDLKTVSLVAQALEMGLIDIITYPEKFVNIKELSHRDAVSDPEVILQIKIYGDKKKQILKTVFEHVELEVLK